MSRQNIFTGTAANDGTGDDLREAFTKVNDNFTELYSYAPVKITTAPGTQASNDALFDTLESANRGSDVDMSGYVFTVTKLRNECNYHNGAFKVSGDIIQMPKNPLAHPFEGANMMIVNPVMRDYQGSALFWQKPSDPARWIMAWRESVQHGINNGTRIVSAETVDKMRRVIGNDDKKLVYTDPDNDATIHCAATMGNGRLGFIARIENETGTYSDPKFFYSDDNGATWSNTTITTTLDTTPYGDMLPYPASVGGHDTLGFIWYYYQSTKTHAVYTLDNGNTWTELTNVALRGATAAVQEASVVRIGNEQKWVMFSRNGANIGVHLSTNMTTWGNAVYGDLYLAGNPPQAFYEGGYIWILAASRENNVILSAHENSLLIARVDPTELWNSGGTSGFSGWQVITSASFWPMSYFTVRKIREKYYAFGQLVEGHTAGGSTSRTSMLALLSRDSIEQAPIQQTLNSIPQSNLLSDPEFYIWPRGTTVTGTTRKSITPDCSFARGNFDGTDSPVGNWTISRQPGWRNEYCMRISRDDGDTEPTPKAHYMSLTFVLNTPDSIPFAKQQDFMQTIFAARRGSGFSATNSSISIRVRQTATPDQKVTGILGNFPVGDSVVATSLSTIQLSENWEDKKYAVGPIAKTTKQLLVDFRWQVAGTASNDYWEIEWSSPRTGFMGGIGYGYDQTVFIRDPYIQVLAKSARRLQTFTVKSENGSRYVAFPNAPLLRVPDVTLSAGSASDITVNGFELSHTSAATITVEVDAGL